MIRDKQTENAMYYLAAFRRILHQYQSCHAKALEGYELSPNEISVLSCLGESTTASQIAEEFDVSKALVSRSVKLLKQRGMIDVAISANDKREQVLSLTPKGDEAAKIIAATNDDFVKRMMASLDGDKQSVFKLLLKLIIANLNIGGAK